MESIELKFILKLLGCANYRSSLSAFDAKSFKGKDKICHNLGTQELIDYSREIASVEILSPGRALLEIDAADLPINPQELKVLEKVAKESGKIAPSKLKLPSSIKATDRETILKNLSERGLVEVESKLKTTKAEVWLTERGIEYFRDYFNPNKGSNPVISLELLDNYIRFLRKQLRVKSEEVSALPSNNVESSSETIIDTINITDDEILQTIQKLDKELGTDNYLPIFHLRQKLQPPLSRDELDKALYRLQANDQIELSTLLDPTPYTSEQFNAGISQNIGGSLFFISIN
jgi:DNA-binding MarR family transcriptional regulator